MDRPLEGKVALVTGGGLRLGRAIAEGLALSGADAAVHYHASEQGAQEAVARGGGDVVNVLDVGGALMPWRHSAAYGISKAALAHLTEVLALELAPAIRVNGVAPGTVLPPVDLDPPTLERLRAHIPQGRFGSPQDVVEAVRFLVAGPRFITGQVIAVDGGRSKEGGFA